MLIGIFGGNDATYFYPNLANMFTAHSAAAAVAMYAREQIARRAEEKIRTYVDKGICYIKHA